MARLDLAPDVLEDLIGHVKWRVARDPDGFHAFPITGVDGGRFTFTEEFRGAPVLRILYKMITDDLISLAWVERVDDAPPIGFDDFLS